MAKHIKTGITGEQWGEAYLVKEGYLIAEKNWRHGWSEVDIIAIKKLNAALYRNKSEKDKKLWIARR